MILAFILYASTAFAWDAPCEEAPASENLLRLVESGTVAVVSALFS